MTLPLTDPRPSDEPALRIALRAAVIDQHATTTGMPLWDAVLEDLTTDNPLLAATEWLDSLSRFAAGEIHGRGAEALQRQADAQWSHGGLTYLQGRLRHLVEGRLLPEALLRSIEAESAAVAEGERAKERRDELVRTAMKVKLPRPSLAAAARVSEPRLYQIRDGRR